MEDGFVIQVLGGHHGFDDVLHQVLVDLVVGDVWGVLGGDEDGVHAQGDHGAALLFVFHRHLGLAVRSQPCDAPALPDLQSSIAVTDWSDEDRRRLPGLQEGAKAWPLLIVRSGCSHAVRRRACGGVGIWVWGTGKP
jgi:hypothetical protein